MNGALGYLIEVSITSSAIHTATEAAYSNTDLYSQLMKLVTDEGVDKPIDALCMTLM